MTTPNDKDDLRRQIYNISLTKINDIYYVPPGMNGSVGLSKEKIDKIIEIIATHDQNLKAAVLAKRLKVSVPNDDLMDMVEIEVVPTQAINKVFEEEV